MHDQTSGRYVIYVIVPIHDFDQVIYKIRAIDFDQQSYEGEFSLYRPQLFKDNEPIIDLVKINY